MLADARHAARSLARNPGLTAIAVITLALGIGATTAIFSAVYHTLLRPLPFPDAERLAFVWLEDETKSMMITPQPPFLDAWRGRTRTIEAMAAYAGEERVLTGTAEPEPVYAIAIETGLPTMLGVAPLAGRLFTSEEMLPNGPRVAILSEGLWQRRGGGSGDPRGETVELDGERYQVIGVLPNQLGAISDGREAQIWLPLVDDTLRSHVSIIARVRAGTSLETASAELASLKPSTLDAQMAKWSPKLVDPATFVDSATRTALPILLAAVAVVLLIACANVAGLLLVRVAGRQREVAVRAALGAGRSRIARLIGTEALLLAVLGGGAGVLLATWLTDVVRLLRPDELNSLDTIRVDPVTLAVALGATLASALFFGITPALAAIRGDLTRALIGGGSGARITAGTRVRSILVIGQIALSLVLLVAATLLVRSVAGMRAADRGFEPAGVLTARLPLDRERYPSDESRSALYDDVLARVRAIPGVTHAAITTGVPTEFGVMLGAISIPERDLSTEAMDPIIGYAGVTPDYLDVLRIPLLEGRNFSNDDADADVVIINRTLAEKLWPGESALGRQFRIGNATTPRTVIGVTENIVTGASPAVSEHPQLFAPFDPKMPSARIAVRAAGEPAAIAGRVRSVIAQLDPQLALRDVATMSSVIADSIARERFYMQLLSAFATLALLLAVVGLYGVIGNAVAQRTHEIGIRVALGATPRAVRELVGRQALLLTVLGLVLGIAASVAVARLLGTLLYGVSPLDPASYAVGVGILLAGALIAVWLPVRRATRVDPLVALRD